jgi:hypothetical protein
MGIAEGRLYLTGLKAAPAWTSRDSLGDEALRMRVSLTFRKRSSWPIFMADLPAPTHATESSTAVQVT